jgi:chemotaxis protein MotB
MRRRRREEGHENLERWLVSYADFITLLFAFFVVMYAISSINEGKYRVLSDALVAAFRAPQSTSDPIELGQLSRASTVQSRLELIERPHVVGAPLTIVKTQDQGGDEGTRQSSPDSTDREPSSPDLQTISDAINQSLQPLVEQGLVTVRTGDRRVEVEIKDSVLFPSASAQLQQDAIPVIGKVADVLRGFANPVRVEGFTDNLPINTLLYPSNWELSGARAASVVRLLAKDGIDPQRLSALGYGEFRPVASNETPEGRAQNRRVVLVVLAGDESKE